MVRSHNEDSIANDVKHGLVILADGMGGYNAGEVASGMATTVLMTELQNAIGLHAPFDIDPDTGLTFAQRMLKDQIEKANTSIYQASQSQPQYAGMGTTLVASMFYDNRMTVAHIGDSRLYLLRGAEFSQVTRDHSLLQEQIDSGMITVEEAKHSQNKNLVTRALGIDPVVEPEVHDYDTKVGDIYLLCSDGLSDMVPDDEIGLTLETLEHGFHRVSARYGFMETPDVPEILYRLRQMGLRAKQNETTFYLGRERILVLDEHRGPKPGKLSIEHLPRNLKPNQFSDQVSCRLRHGT